MVACPCTRMLQLPPAVLLSRLQRALQAASTQQQPPRLTSPQGLAVQGLLLISSP